MHPDFPGHGAGPPGVRQQTLIFYQNVCGTVGCSADVFFRPSADSPTDHGSRAGSKKASKQTEIEPNEDASKALPLAALCGALPQAGLCPAPRQRGKPLWKPILPDTQLCLLPHIGVSKGPSALWRVFERAEVERRLWRMKRDAGPVSKGAQTRGGPHDHCELWGALNVPP